MSTFFTAAQQCEAGKPRPKLETNTALLRLPYGVSRIHSNPIFTHFTSKHRKEVLRGAAGTSYSEWKPSPVEDADTSITSPTKTIPPLNYSALMSPEEFVASIPEDVYAAQQFHRDNLSKAKGHLLRLEERDANDVLRRAKVKRLEGERQRRIRRIAAGLQDMSTIDFDPEEDAPTAKRIAVLGTSYHTQTPSGYLTATMDTHTTITDYFNVRVPTIVYSTDAIYGTPIHSTVAEAAAVKALEEGANGPTAAIVERGSANTRATTNSHQIRSLLKQQQQLDGLQGLSLTVGEAAARNTKDYLRGKYGPSMLWPSTKDEALEDEDGSNDNGSSFSAGNGRASRKGGRIGKRINEAASLFSTVNSSFSSGSAASRKALNSPPRGLAGGAGVVGGPMSTGATPTTTILTADGPRIRHGIPRRLQGQSASQLAEALIARDLHEKEKEAADTSLKQTKRRARSASLWSGRVGTNAASAGVSSDEDNL